MTARLVALAEIFFKDFSSDLDAGLQVWDDTLALLSTFPNVLITPHSAFLTNEALVRWQPPSLAQLYLRRLGARLTLNANAFPTGQHR
eukprot:scaffold990_cov393-Prasinococcus_capsulatus_cf.AAC.6